MDNSFDICRNANIFAIFQCDTVYFGLVSFKPERSFVFTCKGLQILANEKLNFNIPMEYVDETHLGLSSESNSIIVIKVARQYAAYIEKTLKASENIEIASDGKNFTSDKITLFCAKLENYTKDLLQDLFPSLQHMDVKATNLIVQTLRGNSDSLTKKDGDASREPLELHSKTPTNKIAPTSVAITQTETEKQYTINSTTRIVDLSDESPKSDHDLPSKRAKLPLKHCIEACPKNAEESDFESLPYDDNRTILTYHHATGNISLTVGDYVCLSSGEYLNDKIIDFYMKYIQNKVMETKDRQRTYIFSSFFYHVLSSKYDKKEKIVDRTEAECRHERVRMWTKNVNIFEKDFLFIPINERAHWYLAVICFANMLLTVNNDSHNNNENVEQNVDSIKQPVILIFNSMANPTNYRHTMILRDYLTCEYNARMKHLKTPANFTKETIPGHRIKVPQQRNLYDCGVYLVQYVEEFFKNPIKDFRVPINQLEDWFDAMTIIRKREEIAKLIQNLIIEQHRMMGTSPKLLLPSITFPTLNGKLLSENVE